MKHSITVFTTTYNRAYILNQLYESLLRQTSKDFCWLIIDDGSKDNTGELVGLWIAENKIPIKYIYQENKGMLSGHNTAYDNITTELNVCIDSDDFMPDDAIEKILLLWNDHRTENIAGLVGLDSYINGQIIGEKFPRNLKSAYFHDLIDKYKITGDKKYVFRTDIVNEFPRYPVFKDEKFPAQSYLYRLISEKYRIALYNEVFCIVEYLEDGNSKNKFESYKKNACSYAFYRKEMIRLSKPLKNKFRHAIHYVSSCIFAKQKMFYGKDTLIIAFAYPIGVFLNFYLRKTNKKSLV